MILKKTFKVSQYYNLACNMGYKYILYRLYHILLIKSGLIKLISPTRYRSKKLITLAFWKKQAKPFFFKNREALPDFKTNAALINQLQADYTKIKNGEIQYFNNEWLKVGFPINWHHNPESDYTYPQNIHWANIEDLSSTNGDIKYVWEKSRFAFLYTIIRYDQHFKHDSSSFVFELLNDWIDKNPINEGPNYKCSQEISLRILNWTFALYFYQNSQYLTEELFNKILNSIRQQLIHVYKNIHFSRLTVRNNHALTETLCLYITGVLFPSFPEAKKYQEYGKAYFEKEIAYQIYKDGSYLQFSMNYHRIVIQLLTWALQISKNNGLTFAPFVLDRAQKTMGFLAHHQDTTTGYLPNYGANDGALFFKLNGEAFRNFQPQLNALQVTLRGTNGYADEYVQEDAWWYSGGKLNSAKVEPLNPVAIYKAPIGGFYVLRHPDYFAMLRCGNHKDRPQQADQNHLDLWYKGVNILRDNGSYKYNTDVETINYFSGTASHNTLQIGENNQMLKGGRFIWYYWSQAESVETKSASTHLSITAKAKVYQQLGNQILHQRTVKQFTEQAKWEIEDTLQLGDFTAQEIFYQRWHIADEFEALGFHISAFDKKGNELKMTKTDVWYSDVYGAKTPSTCIVFESEEPYFSTIIWKNVKVETVKLGLI
jgi:hypothetical protein